MLPLIAIGTPANGAASPGTTRVGRGQRPLAVDLDERVERRLERLDPAQRGLDDLARARVAGAHERGGLFGRDEREVVHVAPAPYLLASSPPECARS